MGMHQTKVLGWFPASKSGEGDATNPACDDVAFRVDMVFDDDVQYHALLIDEDMKVWQLTDKNRLVPFVHIMVSEEGVVEAFKKCLKED